MLTKILAALLLITLALAGWQHIEVMHYQSRALTLQSAAITFESAQQTNLATIATL